MSFVFFSPASEQSAANSIIQIDSVDVCTIAYDAYVIPAPVDPAPLFTFAPPFDTGNTSDVTIRGSTAAVATNSPISPASTQVGDLVIVFHWTRDAAGVPTNTLNSAGGFVEIRSQPHDDGSTDGRLSVAYKLATVAGANSYQAYTSNFGTDYAGIVVLNTGTYNVSQSIVSNSSTDTGTSPGDGPPITTPVDRCLVFAVTAYHVASPANFLLTPPAGYSEVWEISGSVDAELTVATKFVATAGLEDPGAWTDNGTPSGTSAMTFAIRPPNRFIPNGAPPSLIGPDSVIWGPWPQLMEAKFQFSSRYIDVISLSSTPSFVTLAFQETGSQNIHKISWFENTPTKKIYEELLLDTPVITEQLQVQAGILLIDTVSFTEELLTPTRTRERSGSDTISVTDSATVETTKSKVVEPQDAISIPDFITLTASYSRTLLDSVSVTDAVARGRENFKDLSDSAAITEDSVIDAFTPASYPGLLIWVDSQNNVTGTNPVSQWANRSGAPAVSYPAVNTPILTANSFKSNTKPGMTMLADCFDPGGILGGQATHSIFITFKTTQNVTAGSSGVGMVLLQANNGNFTIGLEGGTLRYRYFNGTSFSNYDTSVTNLNDGNPHTIAVTNTGVVAFMCVDNNTTVGGGNTGSPGTVLLPPRYIGARTGTPLPVQNPFKGEIAEVIAYSGFINSVDVGKIMNYMIARWH